MFHDIKICFFHLMNSKFRFVFDWKAMNVSLDVRIQKVLSVTRFFFFYGGQKAAVLISL